MINSELTVNLNKNYEEDYNNNQYAIDMRRETLNRIENDTIFQTDDIEEAYKLLNQKESD